MGGEDIIYYMDTGHTPARVKKWSAVRNRSKSIAVENRFSDLRVGVPVLLVLAGGSTGEQLLYSRQAFRIRP